MRSTVIAVLTRVSTWCRSSTGTAGPTRFGTSRRNLAMSVADVADAFTLPHFLARDFTVDWKTNATEVTEIDRRAETLIDDAVRRLLVRRG